MTVVFAAVRSETWRMLFTTAMASMRRLAVPFVHSECSASYTGSHEKTEACLLAASPPAAQRSHLSASQTAVMAPCRAVGRPPSEAGPTYSTCAALPSHVYFT